MARTYVYRCNTCKYEYEIEQSITSEPISLCPSCDKEECERLICEPLMVSAGPKTLGTLAEQNTRNMGTYERESKQSQNQESRQAANKTMAEIASGGKRVSASSKPWYQKQNSVTPQKIKKMNRQQLDKFIVEGKTP